MTLIVRRPRETPSCYPVDCLDCLGYKHNPLYQPGKKLPQGALHGHEHRLWAFVPLAVGLLLLIGACMLPETFWIGLVLGAMALIKGAYFILGPLPQVNSL